MKTLALFLSFFLLSLPEMLVAQTVNEMLQKVSATVDADQQGQAVSFFRQAVALNIDRSEMFYWTSVDKNSGISQKFAYELATAYRKGRNYDKSYLFYKELLQKSPNNVDYLAVCAEMEVCRGNEKGALALYEKVLQLDADNLSANIFLGNYYYLMAERDKHQLESDYKKIASPTRMQYASYRNELSNILATGYKKAKDALQKVIREFPSTEATKTLDRILLIEKEANR